MEQRPDDIGPFLANARHSVDTASAQYAHDHGFQLIVCVMGGRQPLDFAFLHPVVQQSVTRTPRCTLNAAADRNNRPQNFVRDTAFLAKRCYKFRFGARGRAQAVIDGCGGDPARKGLQCEQQQRQTVGSAGNGQSQFLVIRLKGRNQPVKRRHKSLIERGACIVHFLLAVGGSLARCHAISKPAAGDFGIDILHFRQHPASVGFLVQLHQRSAQIIKAVRGPFAARSFLVIFL